MPAEVKNLKPVEVLQDKTKVMFGFWAAELFTGGNIPSFSTASSAPINNTGRFVRAAEFEMHATARHGSSTPPKKNTSVHDGIGIGDEGLRGGAGGPEPDNAMANGDYDTIAMERRQQRLLDPDAARGWALPQGGGTAGHVGGGGGRSG